MGAWLRLWGWRAVFVLGAAMVGAGGCARVHQRVDGWALDKKAALIKREALSERTARPLPYASADELELKTRPTPRLNPSRRPLADCRLPESEGLIQEELAFDSAWPLRFPESDRARAYVYRHGPLGERPAVLWMPGQSTDAFIFRSLVPYLQTLSSWQLDIVFFVPPYHLERTPAGFPSGDAFLATDFPDHLAAFGQALSDARSLVAWLREQGVTRLGAIGSSLGGSLLLRMVTWDESFDFLTLIAPVVRWELLVFQPEMAPVREQLASGGLETNDVLQAYRALDPTRSKPKTPARHIAIFYGEHDRVTPRPAIFELAEAWHVSRLRGFDSGHALLFLAPQLSREVKASLDRDLRALGWHGGKSVPPPAKPSAFPLCP